MDWSLSSHLVVIFATTSHFAAYQYLSPTHDFLLTSQVSGHESISNSQQHQLFLILSSLESQQMTARLELQSHQSDLDHQPFHLILQDYSQWSPVWSSNLDTKKLPCDIPRFFSCENSDSGNIKSFEADDFEVFSSHFNSVAEKNFFIVASIN